jgi:hypothetical protein
MPCLSYLLIIEAVAVDSLRRDFLVAEYRIQEMIIKLNHTVMDEYSRVLRRNDQLISGVV